MKRAAALVQNELLPRNSLSLIRASRQVSHQLYDHAEQSRRRSRYDVSKLPSKSRYPRPLEARLFSRDPPNQTRSNMTIAFAAMQPRSVCCTSLACVKVIPSESVSHGNLQTTRKPQPAVCADEYLWCRAYRQRVMCLCMFRVLRTRSRFIAASRPTVARPTRSQNEYCHQLDH